MPFEVEYTDEFGDWWDTLSEHEQDDVAATVELLADKGPTLPFPYSSGIEGSKHSHIRELRIQHAGKPYRVLYAVTFQYQQHPWLQDPCHGACPYFP